MTAGARVARWPRRQLQEDVTDCEIAGFGSDLTQAGHHDRFAICPVPRPRGTT